MRDSGGGRAQAGGSEGRPRGCGGSQLYRREWAFYQHTRHMIPLRIPRLLATVEKTSGDVEGLILEDLSLLPEATQMPPRPSIEQVRPPSGRGRKSISTSALGARPRTAGCEGPRAVGVRGGVNAPN